MLMSNFPFKGFHLAKRKDTLGSREEKKVSDRPHTHLPHSTAGTNRQQSLGPAACSLGTTCNTNVF